MNMGGPVPRTYRLGKRAEAQAETRDRIVAATLRLYREVGVTGATVPAVARAADVAPATVRNHFPDPRDLADAAAEAILADSGMPDASIFDGVNGLAERIERLLLEVSAFFERSTGWWEVREADRSAGNAWEAAEAGYQARITALIRNALEPLGDDPIAVAVIDAVLVHVYFSIRAGGGSVREAVDVERQFLVPWLDARSRTRAG
jgi:AcrR family transcriptional regulator